MHAAALRLELRIPDTHSLKQKRGKLRTLTGMLSKKFPVAVAEVGFQDQWQRATVGVAVVAADGPQLRRLLHVVERAVREHVEVEVLEVGMSYLEEVS